MADDNVAATVVRSPIHASTWVPMLPDTDVWDCAYAGPLRQVKEAAYERVQSAMRGEDAETLRWRRAGPDTWELVSDG